MELKKDTILQQGKYRIVNILGQGGFGITYLAVQVRLNREVAIKEFYMKDYCNRDDSNSVSVGSIGSSELVSRYKDKFLKEAEMIAGLNNPNIVRIHDIFEENGTAYYVMEYVGGGSLSDLVADGKPVDQDTALKYINQVASALQYIHNRQISHLDIKPGNILLDDKQNAVLIDFGMSKHYDVSGQQTSTTPVGISKGYAPLEQYNQNLNRFSPQTDIYSLGATLYKLVTGETPPEATIINEDGLPAKPQSVSPNVWDAITAAMQPRRKDRPSSVAEFLAILTPTTSSYDATRLASEPELDVTVVTPEPKCDSDLDSERDGDDEEKKSLVKIIVISVVCVVVLIVLWLSIFGGQGSSSKAIDYVDTTELVDSIIAPADSAEALMVPASESDEDVIVEELTTTPIPQMNVESEPKSEIQEQECKASPQSKTRGDADLSASGKASESQNSASIYNAVDQNPEFPGGLSALSSWLSTHISYPASAAEAGISGRVVVQFVVEKDGHISSASVVRGKDPALDAEAIRVVSSMPRWTPGRLNGSPVRVRYNLPINFKLPQ